LRKKPRRASAKKRRSKLGEGSFLKLLFYPKFEGGKKKKKKKKTERLLGPRPNKGGRGRKHPILPCLKGPGKEESKNKKSL